MKLPSFQFYPGDWRKDPGVQSLDYHDRGVWFEMLCLMSESEQRGKLVLNGKPMPEQALARLLGLDNQILTTTLTTLLTSGVASREQKTGIIFCRRMVRDEKVRSVRVKCGKMGGNPDLLNQKSNQKPTTQVNQKPTPSSSTSSSDSTPLPPKGGEGGAHRNGNGNRTWVLTKRLEAIAECIKEIEGRGFEDAMGLQIRPADKTEYNRLKQQRKKLRNEIAG